MAQTITAGDTDLAHLDELGLALTGLGFLTVIVTAGPRPRLEVLNRTAPDRYGSVLCEAGTAGDRWFWWSWADRIAPVQALEQAAAIVDRTLQGAADTA